ncbi:MAG TPA: RNA methyltransferase [Candidatus Tumulicola sp.]|nr:RNA methyltransferase [Candidatus Tumulicola sp.]
MANGSVGFHSPQIRAARLLHQKKHRTLKRCFLIEGPTLIEAALEAGAHLEAVFVVPERHPAVDAAASRARETGVPVHPVEPRSIDALAQTKTPQGIVAVARFFDRPLSALAELLPEKGPVLVLALHDLDDPGNAGTMVRSAEAFGAAAACFGPHSVEPYNDKVVRAAMGSLFRLPIFRYERWEEMLRASAQSGLCLVAAQAGAPDVRSITPGPRIALVVGNERRGLEGIPPDDIAQRVGIPQSPQVESLNAAIAGSILLYELARSSGLLKAKK